MKDRAFVWIVLMWCTWAILVCGFLFMTPGVPTQMGGMLTAAGHAMTPEATKEIIVAIAGVCGLAISSYAAFKTKKIDSSVNNRHHYAKDEDGEPLPGPDGKPVKLNLVDMAMNNHDKLVLIGAGVKETKRLANENRDLIIGVQDEQARVKDALKQMKNKGCDKISDCQKDG